MSIRVLSIVAQILSIALVFVAGAHVARYPLPSLAALAVGSGWIGVITAALLRRACDHKSCPWED